MSPTSYLAAPPRVMGRLRVQGAVYMRLIPGGQGANPKLFNPDQTSQPGTQLVHHRLLGILGENRHTEANTLIANKEIGALDQARDFVRMAGTETAMENLSRRIFNLGDSGKRPVHQLGTGTARQLKLRFKVVRLAYLA